jgi:hypothetical protein
MVGHTLPSPVERFHAREATAVRAADRLCSAVAVAAGCSRRQRFQCSHLRGKSTVRKGIPTEAQQATQVFLYRTGQEDRTCVRELQRPG